MFAMIYSILETFAARILRSKLQELQESRLTERQQREEQQMKSLSTFNELRHELEKATEEIRKLKAEKDYALKSEAAQKEECARWKQNWEASKDRNASYEVQIESHKKALTRAYDEREQWRKNWETVQGERDQLRQEKQVLNESLAACDKDIRILKEKIARHRNLCALSVDRLLHIVSDANNYAAAIRKELAELQ